MPFPILGSNSAVAEFAIDNSLRFDNNANYLFADRFGSPTNADKYTLSFWIKRCSNGAGDELFSYNYGSDSSNIGVILSLRTDDTLRFNGYAPGSDHFDVRTNRLFRDPSAWYHLVFAYDSTQSTASNRQKIYVNGAEETSLAASSYTSQNFDGFLATTPNNNKGFIIGSRYNSSGGIDSASYTDGYMADVYFTDGYAYAASDFGETNANGVWVPKEADVTFGTNGYHLEFKQTGTSANASGIGADTSGNDNHFSVGNITSIDVTTDTPTNNFCTLNPLAVSRLNNDGVYSEGNTKITSTSTDNDRFYSVATMGVTSGKWYWEIKVPTASRVETGVGILTEIMGTSQHYNNETNPNIISVNAGGNIYGKGGADYDDHQNWAADLSDNDIIMWALDMDNYELWYGINGTWQDSGDPTSGATGTGGIINETSNAYRTKLNHGDFIHPWVSDLSTSGQTAYELNFGNAPFSISSGNSDANGYGNFEYAVPSGFYALCTKNLAVYG